MDGNKREKKLKSGRRFCYPSPRGVRARTCCGYEGRQESECSSLPICCANFFFLLIFFSPRCSNCLDEVQGLKNSSFECVSVSVYGGNEILKINIVLFLWDKIYRQKSNIKMNLRVRRKRAFLRLWSGNGNMFSFSSNLWRQKVDNGICISEQWTLSRWRWLQGNCREKKNHKENSISFQ